LGDSAGTMPWEPLVSVGCEIKPLYCLHTGTTPCGSEWLSLWR